MANYPTASEFLAQKWAERVHEVYTSPLYSTSFLVVDVENPVPASGPTLAHAVVRPQTLTWFNYGTDQGTIDDGFNGTRKATGSDTNLTEPRLVPGERDMAIQAFSMTVLPAICRWDPDDLRDETLSAEVRAAYVGGTASAPSFLFDPASATTPPQLHSPFNLQDVFGGFCRQHLELKVSWDNDSKRRRLGLAEGVPEGKGRSYLTTHGEPATSNRWIISEGLLWESSGKADRQMVVEGRFHVNAVVPITLPTALLGLSFDTARPVPTGIAIPIRLYAHGVQYGQPGKN